MESKETVTVRTANVFERINAIITRAKFLSAGDKPRVPFEGIENCIYVAEKEFGEKKLYDYKTKRSHIGFDNDGKKIIELINHC